MLSGVLCLLVVVAPLCATSGVEQAGASGSGPSEVDLSRSPRSSPFRIRGTLPWHNFLSGPTAWTEEDYRAYLDEMARRKLNLVAFHCYTGGAERYAPYVEPMIRLHYRDVVPEAGWDTSLTARWGYRPLAIQDFAFGTGASFLTTGNYRAFGSPAAVLAEDNASRYRKAHELMRQVIDLAHARHIQVAIGFEFGVHPPEFASIVPPSSRIPGALLPDPTHPANVEILQSALDDILSEYPGVDWFWLWLHEHSMFIAEPVLKGRFGAMLEQEKGNFGAANPHDTFTGVWSLIQIRQVYSYLSKHSPRTGLVIGGWGGGPQLPPVLEGLDRALPTNIVFSCLNPGMGSQGHAPVLNRIATHRPVWSMPWLEGDGSLWHLQLRAGSMLGQVKAAAAARLDGVVAIHWRTEETRPNIEAFASAAADPVRAGSEDEFYQRYCLDTFGPTAGRELAPTLLRFERDQKLANLPSPEFFPYDPGWGRMLPEFAAELRKTVSTLDTLKLKTSGSQHRANIDWLADNLRFALLLDEVGRKMEPAYRFKEAFITGDVPAADLEPRTREARAELASAPIEQLFKTFSRRVRSRGELGELSSLNQKLWLQYRELDRFLQQPALK